MWFNILTENHGRPETVQRLDPIIRYLRSVLGGSGHDVTVVHDQLYPKAINIYLENFLGSRDYAAEFRQLRRTHGIVIGVIATELMIGGTIPYARHGITFKSAASGEELIRRRVSAFEATIAEADFLWSFLPRTADEYSTRCAVSEFFPVGSTVLVPADERRSPKDVDIFFFGKATPHRAAVINSLTRAGLQVAFAAMAPRADGFLISWLRRCLIGQRSH